MERREIKFYTMLGNQGIKTMRETTVVTHSCNLVLGRLRPEDLKFERPCLKKTVNFLFHALEVNLLLKKKSALSHILSYKIKAQK
jgi:hypothetical protein